MIGRRRKLTVTGVFRPREARFRSRGSRSKSRGFENESVFSYTPARRRVGDHDDRGMERGNRSGTERTTACLAGQRAGDSIRTANAAEYDTERRAAKRRNADTADHGDGAEGNTERADETGDDGATAARRSAQRRCDCAAAPARTAPVQTAVPAQTAAQIAAAREAAATRAFTQQVEKANQVRDNIMPKTGTDVTTVTHQDISNAPGGANQSVSDILVTQFPGVSQDSTSIGDYHVRNEHANVQFRINGIILPDGVSGFGQFLETSFIGRMALLTGALPAQYGLHNTAILDITSKDFTTNPNSGSVGVYGGSNGTITPTFEYGGKVGNTEYFFAAREFPEFSRPRKPDRERHRASRFQHAWRLLRLHLDLPRRVRRASARSPAPRPSNIKSRPIRASRRFQVCFRSIGAPADGGDSAKINEVQYEKSAYGVLAWQKSLGDIDMQLAYFSRYNSLLFVPDHLRRYPLQRSRLERRPHLVHERPAGGQRLQGQRCAHSPVRIQFERRAGHCPHHRDGRTLLRRRRQRHRRPVQFRRSEHQDRLSRRRLPAGRVADHAEPDAQLGRALRPDVAIRRQAPAQPARQFRLHTHAGHHSALGLCAVLYAAAPDPRSPGERGAVRGHDGRAAVERTEPDPAGAVASGRCRHQSSSCCLRVLRPRQAQS